MGVTHPRDALMLARMFDGATLGDPCASVAEIVATQIAYQKKYKSFRRKCRRNRAALLRDG